MIDCDTMFIMLLFYPVELALLSFMSKVCCFCMNHIVFQYSITLFQYYVSINAIRPGLYVHVN